MTRHLFWSVVEDYATGQRKSGSGFEALLAELGVII